MRSKPCSLSLCIAATTFSVPTVVYGVQAPGSLPPPRFAAEAAIGFEYDSNVSIEEVDRTSNESDFALTLDAGVELEQEFSPLFEAGINYDYSQSNYSEFSRLDRQTHILGADITWHLSQLDAGVSAFYINSQLDGDSFLELARVSPALSGFLAKRWFARGAWVYQEKSLENQSLRDATAQSTELDVYFFAQGLRRYFNLGYRFKDENAEAPSLDYRSDSLKLRYVQRIEFYQRLLKLELSWRYEDRDYRSETQSIGKRRKDRRQRLGFELEIPLGTSGAAALQVYYTYSDYNSNLERVDYTQNVGGSRFIYRW